MQPNLDQSNSNDAPVEIEPLLTAFYAERAPQTGRASRLWQQLEPRLEAAPAKPKFLGLWFKNSSQPRNTNMKTEIPLLDPVNADLPAKPARRLTLASSLVGGLATLTLVAGLILIISLMAGRGPGAGSSVGSQAIPNTVVPVASAGLNPTPTPPPYDGRTVIPAKSDPNASPTPPLYNLGTPAAAPTGQTTYSPPTPVDEKPLTPASTGLTPTRKSTIPASSGPGATSTPVSGKPTDSTDLLPAIKLAGTTNVLVKSLQVVPITFNLMSLPPAIRATNPAVSYYASLFDSDTVLEDLHGGLVAAGYKYVSPDGSSGQAPQWQPGGLVAFYIKPGQPDLYLTLADLPDATKVKEFTASGFNSGIADYEKLVQNMRSKGFKNSLMILSASNLLQVMRDGQNPGAGSPVGPPTPQK